MDANKAVPTTVDSVTVLPVGVMGFNNAFWFGTMQYEKLGSSG